MCPLGVRYGLPDELITRELGSETAVFFIYLTLVTSYPRDNAALHTADPVFRKSFHVRSGGCHLPMKPFPPTTSTLSTVEFIPKEFELVKCVCLWWIMTKISTDDLW
jgi:hypothetical protein